MARARIVAPVVAVVVLAALAVARLRDAEGGELAQASTGVSVHVVGSGAISCVERSPRGGDGLCWLVPAPGAHLEALEDSGVDRTAAVRGGEYTLTGPERPRRLVARFAPRHE